MYVCQLLCEANTYILRIFLLPLENMALLEKVGGLQCSFLYVWLLQAEAVLQKWQLYIVQLHVKSSTYTQLEENENEILFLNNYWCSIFWPDANLENNIDHKGFVEQLYLMICLSVNDIYFKLIDLNSVNSIIIFLHIHSKKECLNYIIFRVRTSVNFFKFF